jgi:hypothetical protein
VDRAGDVLGGAFPGRASLVRVQDAQRMTEEAGRLRSRVGERGLGFGPF